MEKKLKEQLQFTTVISGRYPGAYYRGDYIGCACDDGEDGRCNDICHM